MSASCEYCGASFSSHRTNARFCSATCQMRTWKEQNRSHVNAYQRAWRAKSDKARDDENARRRERRKRLGAELRERENAYRLRRNHRFLPDEQASIWSAQDGRCYLCGDPLDSNDPSGVHVDHDHSCCPKGRSCRICRRGLACRDCNLAIGHAGEDPARLRRIADRLEAAQTAFRQRRSAASQQLLLTE